MSEFLTIGLEDINNSTGVEFKPLEDGSYNAVCVGIVVTEMMNFDKTAKEDKIIFVYQVQEDGVNYYLKSAPNKKSLHEKSGLWKILGSWTKQKDATTLISKMGTNGKFDIKYFIGKPIQLTVKTKDVGEKTYNYISDYMAPKKGQSVVVAPDAIPAYITKDSKSADLITGITVKVFEDKKMVKITDNVKAQPVKEEPTVEDTQINDLPF